MAGRRRRRPPSRWSINPPGVPTWISRVLDYACLHACTRQWVSHVLRTVPGCSFIYPSSVPYYVWYLLGIYDSLVNLAPVGPQPTHHFSQGSTATTSSGTIVPTVATLRAHLHLGSFPLKARLCSQRSFITRSVRPLNSPHAWSRPGKADFFSLWLVL